MNIYQTERERLLEAYGVATYREFMAAEMDDDEYGWDDEDEDNE